jgi:hypothetical protein
MSDLGKKSKIQGTRWLVFFVWGAPLSERATR